MNYYYISFEYCINFPTATHVVSSNDLYMPYNLFVKANSFEEACEKIKNNFESSEGEVLFRNFLNLTIE